MRTDYKVIELDSVRPQPRVRKDQDPLLIQFFSGLKRRSKVFRGVTKVTESIAVCAIFFGMCAYSITGMLLMWALGVVVLVIPYILTFLGAFIVALYCILDDARIDHLQHKLDRRRVYHKKNAVKVYREFK